MEEGDLAVLGIQDRNRLVREALIRARRHLGIHDRAAFARLLSQATGGEGPDESTYNRWEHEEGRIIPGWALPTAAQVAGVTIDSLLGGGQLEPSLIHRMDEMESRLQTLLSELRPLGEEVRRLRRAERARRGRTPAVNG